MLKKFRIKVRVVHQLRVTPQCTIDFFTGNRRNEETHEYHYADVVSVATKTKSDDHELPFQPLDLRVGKQFYFEKALFRDFEIVVSSGDRSRIVVGIQDEKRPEEQVELQSSGIAMSLGPCDKC